MPKNEQKIWRYKKLRGNLQSRAFLGKLTISNQESSKQGSYETNLQTSSNNLKLVPQRIYF
jgi:hypothetical protein